MRSNEEERVILSGSLSVNDRVAELIRKQVAEGQQIGCQVCAYKDGEKIVDVWAGRLGPDDMRSVQSDSLFCSWSTTKGVVATAIHILADKGFIDYNSPIAAYWPEFGKNGKEKITVAHALSHRSGLHAVPDYCDLNMLIDWGAWVRYLEEAKTAYEPGTKVGYHAYTYGFILGELVHRVTGKLIGEFIRDEIAKPLGIGDEMFVGIPVWIEDRLATLEIWRLNEMLIDRGMNLPPDSDFFKAMPNRLWGHMNDMRVRRAAIPGANGHFTARALAKMYSALACGGIVDGVRLVSKERISEMNRRITSDFDIVLGNRDHKGLGFMLGGQVEGIVGVMGPHGTTFGHGGAGGSVGFADPEARLSIAVTLNKMMWSDPGQGRTQEICNLIRHEVSVG